MMVPFSPLVPTIVYHAFDAMRHNGNALLRGIEPEREQTLIKDMIAQGGVDLEPTETMLQYILTHDAFRIQSHLACIGQIARDERSR